MVQPSKPGAPPPSKTSRLVCWKARDAYFECLDKNDLWIEGLAPKTHDEIISVQPSQPPIKRYENASWSERKSLLYTCRKFKELYEKECLPSWVTHFETTRIQEKQTDYLMKKLEQDKMRTSDQEFWERVQSK
jgi:cytochrome c oxidase assembly factor 6